MSSLTSINTSYTDGDGKSLVRSDEIEAIFHYNTRGEAWKRDFPMSERVTNPDFSSTTSSGVFPTGWQSSSSETAVGSYAVYTTYTLFAGGANRINSDTSFSQSWGSASKMRLWLSADNDYHTYRQYGWYSSESSGWVSADMKAVVDFDTLFFDWAGDGARGYGYFNSCTKDWHLDASTDGSTYVTLVSGSLPENHVMPVLHRFATTQSYRYLKFYTDSNWGGTYLLLSELAVFMSEDIPRKAVYIYKNGLRDGDYQNYGGIKQSVNLTGVDKLFFDFGGNCYVTPKTLYPSIKLYVGGVEKFDLKSSDLIDSSKNTFAFYSYSVDVSEFSGYQDVEFRVASYNNTYNNERAYLNGYLAKCTVFPSWYIEEFSSYRGSSKSFPDEVLLVVDNLGLSILDVSRHTSEGLPSPYLWMRFDYGDDFFPLSVNSITAKEGKIYLGTNQGLMILDFANDWIDILTDEENTRIYGLGHRRDSTSDSLTLVNPSWYTYSTDSTRILSNNIVHSLSSYTDINGEFILGGTEAGAFTLVSGSVYSASDTSSARLVGVDKSGAFICKSDRNPAVVDYVDIASLGESSFSSLGSLGGLDKYRTDFSKGEYRILGGDLYTTSLDGGILTISGSPTTLSKDGNHLYVLAEETSSEEPVRIDMDVKILSWPSDCPGELRFGAFSNIGAAGGTIDSKASIFLAASNSYTVPFYSDSFTDSFDQWDNYRLDYKTSYRSIPIERAEGLVYLTDSILYNDYNYSVYSLKSHSMVVRFKLRSYTSVVNSSFYAVFSSDYRNYLWGNSLQFCARMFPASSSYYSVRSFNNPTSSWTDLAVFGDEMQAESSLFHEVELHYDGANSMTAYVDGSLIGTSSLTSIGTNVYFILTSVASSDNDVIYIVKDLTVEYPGITKNGPIEYYSVGHQDGDDKNKDGCTYIVGSPNTPYSVDVYGPSFTTEGTPSDSWRTWTCFYDPKSSTIASYIDGEFIGSAKTSNSVFGGATFGIDAQFFPATSTSGSGDLVVEFKNFKVSSCDSSIVGVPEGTTPTSSGVLFGESLSLSISSEKLSTSSHGSIYDTTLLVGTSRGVSKSSLVFPGMADSSVTSFDSGIPAGWSQHNMPGATGSASWTVSSGTLKQAGSILGVGGSLSASQKERGPFGTHLETAYSTGGVGDDFVSVRLRTNQSGTYGVAFNAAYDVSGTVTTNRGAFAVFGQYEFRVGIFSVVYDSSVPDYSCSYTTTYSGDGLDVHKTGSTREIGLRSVSDGVNVYIDGSLYTKLDDSMGITSGIVALISNGNDFVEIEATRVIYEDTLSGSLSKSTCATSGEVDYTSLYGDSNECYSVSSIELTRSAGTALVGTAENRSYWRRGVKYDVVYSNTHAVSAVYVEGLEKIVIFWNKRVYREGVCLDPYCSYISPLDNEFRLLASQRSSNREEMLGYCIRKGNQVAGAPVIGISPSPYAFIYLLIDDKQGAVYELGSSEAVFYPGSAVSGHYRKARLPFQFADREDGYGTFTQLKGGYYDTDEVGTLFFDWYNGRLIFSLFIEYKEKYVFVYPDKQHAWSVGPALDFSYTHSSVGLPDFTADAKISTFSCFSAYRERIYYVHSSGIWYVRLQTNSWHFVSTLPEAGRFTVDNGKKIAGSYSDVYHRMYLLLGDAPFLFIFNVANDSWEALESLPVQIADANNAVTINEDLGLLYLFANVQDEYSYILNLVNRHSSTYNYTSSSAMLPQEDPKFMFSWDSADVRIPLSDSLDYTGDMDFSYWSLSSVPYPGAFPYNFYIEGGSSNSIKVRSTSYLVGNSNLGGFSTRVVSAAVSFTASIKVRISQMDVNSAGKLYLPVFGIGQGSIVVGDLNKNFSSYTQESTGAYGYNGIYMAAVNNGSAMYTLAKRDGATISTSAATDYILFDGTDGSSSAVFRLWSISYNALTKTLSAYIDGTLIGSSVLSSEIFEFFIEVGILSDASTDYNKVRILEFKDFTFDYNNNVDACAMSGGNLVITKAVAENGNYNYYRRFPTLWSGTEFCYETSVRGYSYATSNTPYVFSIGRVTDGVKDINLCALYSGGTKSLGFWSGKDPWTTASGFPTRYTHNWENKSDYRLVNASGTVKVYIDGSSTEAFSANYEDFPEAPSWYDRRVSFGVIEFPRDYRKVLDCSLDWYKGGPVATSDSGAWVRYGPSSQNTTRLLQYWYGQTVYAAASAGDFTDITTVTFPTLLEEDVYVYFEYGAWSTFAGDAPVTIHYDSILDTPAADSYATNSINTVYSNIDYDGTTNIGAITIDINQKKASSGINATGLHAGMLYLGKYRNPSEAILTRDASASVLQGTFFLYPFDPNKRLQSTSTTAWEKVAFNVGDTSCTSSGIAYGVSLLDTSDFTLIDSFGDTTDPSIDDGRSGGGVTVV